MTVRLQHDSAGFAVHVGEAACVVRLQRIAQAAHGGDAHRAGEDGGVTVAGAALRDEAEDLRLVQLDGLRGREVIRGDDHRLVRVDAALDHAHQVVQDAARHIADVGGAGLHVGVVHRGEHGGKLLAGCLHGVLGVAAFLLHGGLDALDEVLVLHEHRMRLEQHGGFVARFLAAAFCQRFQLGDGLLLCLLKPRLLGRQVIGGGLANGRVLTAEEVQRPLHNALGYALTLHENHFLYLFHLSVLITDLP